MEAVGQKQVLPDLVAAVKQDRIQINIPDVHRFAAVAIHFVVHGLDDIPARAFLRCPLNRGVEEICVRQILVKGLNEKLRPLDDGGGVLASTDVVTATVVDHDARLVGQNQLSDTV